MLKDRDVEYGRLELVQYNYKRNGEDMQLK